MMATRGALQLSTQGGDIDHVIASARLAQLRFFLVLAVVMLVLSLRSPIRSPNLSAGSPTPQNACGVASGRDSRFPISPRDRTKSVICPARCAI